MKDMSLEQFKVAFAKRLNYWANEPDSSPESDLTIVLAEEIEALLPKFYDLQEAEISNELRLEIFKALSAAAEILSA